eukprot:UN26124
MLTSENMGNKSFQQIEENYAGLNEILPASSKIHCTVGVKLLLCGFRKLSWTCPSVYKVPFTLSEIHVFRRTMSHARIL